MNCAGTHYRLCLSRYHSSLHFAAPTRAVNRLLERTGLKINDFDLIEVNEAFAAQTLANGKELDWDWSRVNVNGGAIALGHPIGSSGSASPDHPDLRTAPPWWW